MRIGKQNYVMRVEKLKTVWKTDIFQTVFDLLFVFSYKKIFF
jgi:hypothetical protein